MHNLKTCQPIKCEINNKLMFRTISQLPLYFVQSANTECVCVQSTARDKVSGFVLFTLNSNPTSQSQSDQILFTNHLLH